MSVGQPVAQISGQPRASAWTWRIGRTAVLQVVAASLYGVLTHTLFRSGWVSDRLDVMSAGFLFFTPLAMGAIAALPTHEHARISARSIVLAPWVACVLMAGMYSVVGNEPFLCIVMAFPIVLAMSSLGSLGSLALFRTGAGTMRVKAVALVAATLAPFFVAYGESFSPPAGSQRKVHTETIIKAPPAIIWANITRVSEIQTAEQRPSVFHTLGLPKPREAILTYDGVGGVREARFEQGLNFVETVTFWRKQEEMRFTIVVDHSKPLPPLIEVIDSRHFQVLEGRYAIEPLADGTSRLHLDSIEQLHTRFDWYAGLWTDGIMRHLQEYILRIIQERCEQQAARG